MREIEVEVKQRLAAVFGFIVAPVLPSAYLAVAFPFSGDRDILSVLGTLLVLYWFTALATVIVGVPIFLILYRLKLIRWWSAIGFCAIVGVVAQMAMASSSDAEYLLLYAMLGGAAKMLFWMFWRRGMPELFRLVRGLTQCDCSSLTLEFFSLTREQCGSR